MIDQTGTKAHAALAAAGIALADTLVPARRAEILRVPGIGTKSLEILQQDALEKGAPTLLDNIMRLLRQEYLAGAEGVPGWHHQPLTTSRQQIAEILGIIQP